MSEADLAASPSRARRNVIFTAIIAALGGLLFGYDTGIIASALLFIKTDFDLSSFQQGMVVSAVPVGAIFGAAIAGSLSDKYGRRRMILLAAGLFIAGSLVSALAPDATVLIVARVFIGFAIGLASATCPVYISEVAPGAPARPARHVVPARGDRRDPRGVSRRACASSRPVVGGDARASARSRRSCSAQGSSRCRRARAGS